MFTRKHTLGLAVALAASLGFSSLANAATYELIESTTLGTADYGTVTYTQDGSNVDVTVTLNSGYEFINAGQDATVAFNLDKTATISSVPTGYTAVTGNGTSSLKMDGQGLFSNGIQLNGSGASTLGGTTLSFVVDNVSLSDFILSTNPPGSVPSLFAADIITGCTTTNGTTTCSGTTGIVGGATPLPGAFLLFGTVLAGGLGVSRWRKRLQHGPVSVMA
jgi:hypothetical protein